MIGRGLLALAGAALLAGCVARTPFEACTSAATDELREINAAIARTEGNLARGYAIHTQRVPYQGVGRCFDRETSEWYACPQTKYRTDETPVAINAVLERERLQALRARLSGARQRAEAGLAQCRAQFPPG